jgi:hypothetical protein
MGMRMFKKSFLLRIMSIWPPYLGAGIRVKRVSTDFREIDVQMKLRFWNQNYVGTHFGGSMFAMTDPFYMLMLLENLGREFIVWDKGASIRFKKPGKGTIRCEFRLTQTQIDEVIEALKTQSKYDANFIVHIKDEVGDVVAEVEKIVHVRRKQRDLV